MGELVRGRKRALERAAKLVAPATDATHAPAIEPLRCPECSAPVPLGDGSTAVCVHCKAIVELPASYQTLRDHERQRGADRDNAEHLYEQLGSPPSPWLRAWAGFAAVAATAVFGAIMAVVTIFSAAFLLAGFALELVCHALAGLLGTDLIDRFGGGHVYIGFVVIVVLFGILPMWLVGYLDSLAQIKHTLQVNLAAIPPQRPGFPSTCRGCGAALDIPTGAYGVRCPYCEADNIVSLPADWLVQATTRQAAFHRSIVTAVDQAAALRAEMRAGLPTAAKWFAGTAIVFGIVGRGCSALDSEQITASYKQLMGSPRVAIAYYQPDQPIPIDKTVTLVHLPYQVALKHRETLVWSSPDEGGTGTITVKNTTTFPFIAKQWERPWVNNEATFTAPYTGIFVVELHSGQPESGATHLRWSVR